MRNLFILASALFLSTASAQVSNGDFESVIVPIDQEMPTTAHDWAFGTDYGAALVGEAHGGDHALVVWNWYWYGQGLANNGHSRWWGSDGMPVTGHPEQLTGWYKRIAGELEASEGDRAVVRVLLTRWNSTTLQRDTVGSGEQLFGEQATWAPFTLNIDYTSMDAADTVVIRIASCVDCMCEMASNGECAYFHVDDLALTSTTGMPDVLMDDNTVRLLPQGDGSAVVRVAAHTPLPLRLHVWDALGRSIGDVRVSGDGQRIVLPTAPGVVVFDARAGERSLARGRIVMD